MARMQQDVTDAELAVLEVIWELGEATIRAITDRLYPDGGVSHYATVQKLLERLEAKRCVSRDRRATPHVFVARIEREDLIGRRLQALADRLCDGSLAPLLSQLVKGRRLKDDERAALRDLVERLDRGRRRGGG